MDKHNQEKDKVRNLLGLALANFPAMQERNMIPTAMLWEKMLEDVPEEVAEAALLKVLTTARYFPTIAELLEAVHDLTTTPDVSAFEAWGEVQRAIGAYGYPRPAEAMASMSPRTAVVVKQFGWETICMTSMDDVPTLRAQFFRAHTTMAERQKQDALLPAGIRESLKQIGTGHLRLVAGSRGD